MQSENMNMQTDNSNVGESYEPNKYWRNINKHYKKIVDQIKTEGPYILSSHYAINDSPFQLQCGMSFIRSLEPAVRLVNTQDKTNISFSRYEWNELISKLSQLMSHYFKKDDMDGEDEISINSDERVKITKSKVMGMKILKLSSDRVVLYLKETVVNRILRLNETLITFKLSMLCHFDFPEFYGSFTAMLKTLIDHLVGQVDKSTILNALCNGLDNSLESYCIKECVVYYNNEILRNIS